MFCFSRVSSRPRSLSALLVGASILVTGCLTADGAIEANGAVKLSLSYLAMETSTEESQRRQLTAPDVMVSELTLSDADVPGQRRVTAKLATADVDKLEQLPLLKTFNTAIDFVRADDGSGSLKIRLTNPKPLPDATVPGTVLVRVQLPGVVSATSAKKVDGGVEWSFPVAQYYRTPAIEMTAAFAAAEPKADAEAATPEPAPADIPDQAS